MPINNADNSRRNRIPFIVAEVAVVFFGIFRVNDAAKDSGIWVLLAISVAILFCIFLIAIIHRFRHIINESFFIPLTLFLIYIGASFVIKSFIFLFPISLIICCVGALYFNPRALLNYLVISNIVSTSLMISKIALKHPTRTIYPSEMAVLWFMSIVGSVFVYIVTVFASNKNNAAIRAQDSFIGLLNSTNRIVLVDSLNRVTFYSMPFIEMARLSIPDWAVGRPIFDLFKDPELKILFYDILKEDNAETSIRKIMLDGKEHHFEITTARLSDETGGRSINMVDITPVMAAKIEAEEASQAKSAFLATMSHEIRTPLNAIIGLSEVELEKNLSPGTRQNLEKISISGSSLLAIINDILDISKIESHNLDLVPAEYYVPSMINDTISLNIIRKKSKNIDFKLEVDKTIPVKLFGDELRIKQILNNLLSNAFKYTDKGSIHFTISWECRNEDALLSFTVKDTGRGIKKGDIPKLFKDFAQFDIETHRLIEGTGLGLPITKNLTTLMNGTIEVESEYGIGSTFTVRIPQRIIDKNPIGEKTARKLEQFHFMNSPQKRGLKLTRNYMPYGRVLVVDDVETNLDVARGLMLPYGFSMDFAHSGEEAIKKIENAGKDPSVQKYDLILMDHMMPGMDGIETVYFIRNKINNDYAKNVPIIALTANAIAGNEEMFLSRGFNEFISKPVDLIQLDTVLNKWIRDKQSKETIMQAEKEKKSEISKESLHDSDIFQDVSADSIDTIQGLERYSNASAYLNVIRSYHLHTPLLLEKLRTFSGDEKGISLKEYSVIIHGIKGSSYGICAAAAAAKAGELEKAAKSGDINYVVSENASFINLMDSLLQDLGTILQKAAASEKEKTYTKTPDPALLSLLLEAVKQFNASKIESILNKLESFEYESGNELVVWLRRQFDNLDYDAIQERLQISE